MYEFWVQQKNESHASMIFYLARELLVIFGDKEL